jgi:copper resistance protein B
MRAPTIALLQALWAGPALAQHAGHDAAPAASRASPQPAPASAPAADPHAEHDMSAMPGMVKPPTGPAPAPADPHAGHDGGDMLGMAVPTATPEDGQDEAMGPPPLPDQETSAPAAPTDHLADKVFDPGAMDRARAVLRQEHGGAAVSQVMTNLLEYRARSGGTATTGTARPGSAAT